MGPGRAMGARLGAQHPLAWISLAPLLPENPACVWAPKQEYQQQLAVTVSTSHLTCCFPLAGPAPPQPPDTVGVLTALPSLGPRSCGLPSVRKQRPAFYLQRRWQGPPWLLPEEGVGSAGGRGLLSDGAPAVDQALCGPP